LDREGAALGRPGCYEELPVMGPKQRKLAQTHFADRRCDTRSSLPILNLVDTSAQMSDLPSV